MSERYSYNLNALAPQGNMPKTPVFTNPYPFAYHPTVTVMDAYEVNQNSPIPSHALLLAARDHATKIRDKKVTFSAAADEKTYKGVQHWRIPESRELTQAAQTLGPNDVATFFDDFLTAEFYRGALRPNKRVDDITIPKSVSAMKLHVDLLVRAFKSTDDCDDNRHMVQPFIDRRHDSKLVECLCWSIVKACIFRSKSDEPLLTAYEPYKARNSLGLDSFEKRFDAVAMAMTRSKTICKHLFDAPFINTFVDDPLRSIRRVDANRDLNRQKAEVMKKGKTLQQHLKANAGVVPGQKKPKKRSASSAGIDTDAAGARIRTSPTAPNDVSGLPQSAPIGRVTRRMSRMNTIYSSPPETDSVTHTPFGTPSAAGTPYNTPATADARAHLASSPMSSHTEIKDESSPIAHEQGYSIKGHNGILPMGMMYNHGYNQPLMQGINFGPNSYPAMGLAYPFASVNRSSYMNGSLPNYLPSANVMGYRSGPMQSEEVTVSMSGPNLYSPTADHFVDDEFDGEDDGK